MSSGKIAKPTLKDVARQSGVSMATASVVLNNSKRVHISEDTRQKVIYCAEQLGYQIRARKQSQQASVVRRIALVVNLVDKEFFMAAVNGAREAAWQNGYSFSILPYGSDQAMKKTVIKEVTSGHFSGVIFASNITREIEPPEFPEDFPLVLLNCYCREKSKAPAILPSDLVGGHLITLHLIEQGFRRIAHISGEKWMEASQQRLEGYRQALVSNDMVVDESIIAYGNWSTIESYKHTKMLMSSDNKPDAIFAANDEMALGVYMAIKELGLRIPEDVAIAGYDNSPLVEAMTTSLTSLELPYFDMGEMAVENLLSIINGHPPSLKLIKREGKLVVRQSTQRGSRNL